MATTKKPTSPSIDRKGNKFIFSWKKPETYGDGQQLQYYFFISVDSYNQKKAAIAKGKDITKLNWSAVVKLAASKKDYTVTAPSKSCGVIFRVRGNHDQKKNDPGWSDWTYKSFDINAPAKPTVAASWDSSTPNKTTFTYAATDGEHAPFNHVEYRVKWVTNYNGKPAGYTWSGAVSTNSNKTGTVFNTTETVTPSVSNTRIVQVRSVGMGGASAWVFSYHTYATPNAPVITSASGSQDTVRSMMTANVSWSAPWQYAHPIDKTTIEYLATAPAAGMSVPTGATFTQGDTPITSGKSSWAEEISGTLSDDNVLFVRVKVEHDTRENYSAAAIAIKGSLASPTNVSITPNQGTHTIVVNATNASTVPDSYLAVIYKQGETESILGVIPHGNSSANVVVPPWTDDAGSIGVYAVVGSYTAQTADSDGVVIYTIASPQMTSPTVWKGTLKAPTIKVVQADIDNTATVTWDWADEDATAAEVSWADHADAWESTDEPDTYTVDKSKASRLNVSGLEAGIPWYFKVRLLSEVADDVTYGLYSNTVSLNLSSAPSVPSLVMSDQVIDLDGEAIASWVYISNDNTLQKHATIYKYATGVYTPIIQVDSEQSVVISPSELGWIAGDYLLAVEVESESGRFSSMSDTVAVTVSQPLTCTITQTSLTSKTLTIDGNSVNFPYVLDDMPMTVTVTGAGDAGQTILTIKRKNDVSILQPDERLLNGYADEVVCQYVYTGEAQQTITIDDVDGKLNDFANYYIEATVTDDLGRVASDRYPNDDPDDFFKVIWDDQAIMPTATAAIIDDEYAKLTITKPAGAQTGDVIDVYRLTSDRPELIAQDIAMGNSPVVYVDPFPALGANGGYRFVYKTKNGDTIINDSDFAWLDISTPCAATSALIDFNGQRIDLGYNLKITSTWGKDFQETRYLGGSITGDWTAGVSRTGSVDSVVIPVKDPETFMSLRRLAEYEGICHVRTCDGSVITANVDVSDDFGYDTAGKIGNIKISFTRVDPVELDAQPLTDWEVES